MELIVKVLFVENWLVAHHNWPRNPDRYAGALHRLPELPNPDELPKDPPD